MTREHRKIPEPVVTEEDHRRAQLVVADTGLRLGFTVGKTAEIVSALGPFEKDAIRKYNEHERPQRKLL
jgi:hypothetical protein